MSSVNQVFIVGRVGRDPEVIVFQNGGKLVKLSVATSERRKDKQTGETKEETEWHNIVIKNERDSAFVENFVTKGALVAVTGSIKTRKWAGQDGQDRYSTEIVVSPFNGKVTILASANSSGQSEKKAAPSRNQRVDDLDNSIPF